MILALQRRGVRDITVADSPGGPHASGLVKAAWKASGIAAVCAEEGVQLYTGTASGELVSVTMTGKHEVTAVKIKPEAVDPDDIEMLEDLIAAAVNSACTAVDKDSEEEMSKMTGGMNIPGLG